MGRKTRKGGKKPRPGSVLEYKSWCISPPPNSRVIRKSKTPYADMTAEEKKDFCPGEDKVTSFPPLPPSPPESNRSSMSEETAASDPASDPEDKPLTALERLRKQKSPDSAVRKASPGLTVRNFGVHRVIGARRRSRKRKTHRRRR
jgi:hypothetical protein